MFGGDNDRSGVLIALLGEIDFKDLSRWDEGKVSNELIKLNIRSIFKSSLFSLFTCYFILIDQFVT